MIELLNAVSKYSSNNRMNPKNLSLIFGASLLNPPPSASYSLLQQCSLIEIIILNYSYIFEENGGPVLGSRSKDYLPTIPAGINYLNIIDDGKKKKKKSNPKLSNANKLSRSYQSIPLKEEKKSIKSKLKAFSSKIIHSEEGNRTFESSPDLHAMGKS